MGGEEILRATALRIITPGLDGSLIFSTASFPDCVDGPHNNKTIRATLMATYYERIRALPSEELMASSTTLKRLVIGQVTLFALLMVSMYSVVSLILSYASRETSLYKLRRRSFQVTVFIANAVLAAGGLFYEWKYPDPFATPVEDRIGGREDSRWLGTFQIAFQIFALGVAASHIQESKSMMLHHVTVAIVATLPVAFELGFRSYTPFFFGTIELSSLLLVAINVFKENPSLVDRFPGAYTNIRVAFAFSFLLLRVIVYIPRQALFFSDLLCFAYGVGNLAYQAFVGFVVVASLILTGLQLFWAQKILIGLYKLFSGTLDSKRQ